MVFECEASKRAPDSGDDDEDGEEEPVVMLDLALSADENKREPPHAPAWALFRGPWLRSMARKEATRALHGLRACVLRRACSLQAAACSGMTEGVCVSSVHVSICTCFMFPSKRAGDKKKDDDDDKEDCRDLKERKACRKSKSVCSWCANKYAPGAPMCADEVRGR
jgi:hypothetical protein